MPWICTCETPLPGEKVLQPLNHNEAPNIFVQSAGLKILEDLRTEGVKADGLPLMVGKNEAYIGVEIEIEFHGVFLLGIIHLDVSTNVQREISLRIDRPGIISIIPQSNFYWYGRRTAELVVIINVGERR